MNETVEVAASEYMNIPPVKAAIKCGDLEDLESHIKVAFKAGAEWQSNKYAVLASNAVQRAILQHNKEEQKRVLKNYRKICGCFHQGLCTVDCKRCAFHRCETLKDLFKD